MTALKQIVILLLIWNHLVVGIPLDDFYPFGSDAFDTLIAPNDDGSSPGIPLTMSFPFFDTDHDMLFVSCNYCACMYPHCTWAIDISSARGYSLQTAVHYAFD